MSVTDIQRPYRLRKIEKTEPLPLTPDITQKRPRPAKPIYYDPEDFQIDHIPRGELSEIIDSSLGDAKLFASFLILHRFLGRMTGGRLGSEEDPVKLYDCYLSDIEKRVGELCLDSIEVPASEPITSAAA